MAHFTRIRTTLRRGAALLASVALLGAATTLTAAPAHADVQLAACVATQTNTFNPGLTFTPNNSQTFTVTIVFSACVAPNTEITAGTAFASGSATAATCLNPLGSFPAVITVNWNDNTSSVIEYTLTGTATPAGVAVVANGFVLAGTFEGATFVADYGSITLNILQCLTTGVTNLSGVGNALIFEP